MGRCFAFSRPLAYQQDADGESDVVVTYRRTPEAKPTPLPGVLIETMRLLGKELYIDIFRMHEEGDHRY